MKYLYCPKCKELRVKPWYTLTDRCPRCRGSVRVIEVPRSFGTYAVYILTAAAFALVYLNTQQGNGVFLYVALGLVVIMMIIQFMELSRGEKYARTKIKVTHSDLDALRKKGWR